jgi:hypothetical protein
MKTQRCLTAGSLENPVVVVILSMIIGAVFGYVSESSPAAGGMGHGLPRRLSRRQPSGPRDDQASWPTA